MKKYEKPIGPCRSCGCKEKSSFYWSNKSLCKKCVINYQHKHRSDNLEAIQEYDRKRASLPKRVEKRREIAERWKKDPILKLRKSLQTKEWIEKNRIKRSSHMLVQYAIRSKRLFKIPCEVCGNKFSEAHHDDYLLPLVVRWLCKTHHPEHHARIREIKRKSL